MSDQLIQGCVHEWSAENVITYLDSEPVGPRLMKTDVIVICIKCYTPKPPIDLSKPPQTKQILTDSK